MLEHGPIYFVVEGHNRILRPGAFVQAVRGFMKLLTELDASVSRDPQGSVTWEIASLQKESPATIGFRPLHRKKHPTEDYTETIKRVCVTGLDILSKKPERLGDYSDRALEWTEYLAKLRSTDRLDDMRVINDSVEASVGITTLANIQTIKGPAYESVGSVIGKLEAITVHQAFEFRVWSEVTGRPVTCRFSESLFDAVKTALRHKVVVYGLVKWNTLGHPISVSVKDMEKQDEERIPTIEELSGIVEDFTEGMSLKDYLEELRNG